MLWIKARKVAQLWLGSKKISMLWVATARQTIKVYEAIRSCFGSGTWRPDKPWLGDDKWI